MSYGHELLDSHLRRLHGNIAPAYPAAPFGPKSGQVHLKQHQNSSVLWPAYSGLPHTQKPGIFCSTDVGSKRPLDVRVNNPLPALLGSCHLVCWIVLRTFSWCTHHIRSHCRSCYFVQTALFIYVISLGSMWHSTPCHHFRIWHCLFPDGVSSTKTRSFSCSSFPLSIIDFFFPPKPSQSSAHLA